MGGVILTFYSYKGGTGRSMTVANAAWILAASGLRVLAVDWDLEAPGLHRYFQPFLPDPNLTVSPGVIDLVWRFAEATMDTEAPDEPGWHDELANISPYAMSIEHDFPSAGTIDFVPAGRQDATYSALVSQFDWNNFYDRLGGGGFLEALRRDMRARYDYVLIDSRTGLSDTAGICTVQLPDILVNCFSLSNQAIHGAEAVATSVDRQRQNGDLLIFPVPMRVEDGEQDKLEASRDYARALFGRYLTHVADPDRYWGEVEVPYKSFYAYEEILATVGDRPRQENTVLAATERIVGYLTGGRVTELAAVPTESDRRALLARFQRTGPTTETVASRAAVGGPRVFIVYAYESAEQFESVRELWYLLRAAGIDARLDRPPGQRRDDWPDWVRDELNLAGLVLVVASTAYQATEDEPENPASVLRRGTHRALGVVLPGTSPRDLPGFLREHHVVEDMTAAGIGPLRRRVTALAEPGPSTKPQPPRFLAPRSVASAKLEQALDEFAATVRRQWTTEAAIRRLFDPYPIPAPWSTTERPVASPVSQLGWNHATAVRMSGDSTHLSELFLRLPRGRLVVLGAPGSGKSAALIKLTLDMLDARPERGPMPVLLSGASWDPIAEPFDDWIVRWLEDEYPQLAGRTTYGSDTARQLVDGRLIMPVVDGLDELPAEQRARALHGLARVDVDLPVVVASRTEEYQETVGRAGRVLPGAAVVELAPMSLDAVIGYLTLAQPINDRRWQHVLEELRKSPEDPLARVLSTPLMVELVRSAYSTSDTDPAILLDRDRFPTEDSLREHLLDSLVSISYEHQLSTGHIRPERYDPAAARRWLARLARWMETSHSTELAWWQLPRLVAARTMRVALAFVGFLLTALVLGAQTLLYGLPDMFTAIASLAPTAAALVWTGRPHEPVRLRLSRMRLREPVDVSLAHSPHQTLRYDRTTSLTLVLMAFIGAVTAALISVVALRDLPPQRGFALAAAIITISIVLRVSGSAWGQFTVARLVLARRGRLPLRLMTFLDDAHERGILRRVGPVYQFRHAALQRRLAATPPKG